MTNPETARRLGRTAFWGQITVSLALALLVGVMSYYAWLLVADPSDTARQLATATDAKLSESNAEGSFLWTASLAWVGSDIIGLLILSTAFQLFAGYRRGEVFVTRAAVRLRRIGALLIAIGPVSILGEMLCVALLTAGNAPGERQLTFVIDDSDVYAIVIGLIVMAVGHIMTEALRLSEENQSFV